MSLKKDGSLAHHHVFDPEIVSFLNGHAETLVARGITDVNALTDELHRFISPYFVPDLSKRAVRDAFSGYRGSEEQRLALGTSRDAADRPEPNALDFERKDHAIRTREGFASGMAIGSGVVGRLAQSTAGILHIFTTIIAFSQSGLGASIATFFFPVFSEIYWVLRLGPLRGYGLIVIIWTGLMVLAFAGMAIATRLGTEPPHEPAGGEPSLTTVTKDLHQATHDLANRLNNLGLECLRQGAVNDAIAHFREAADSLSDIVQRHETALARIQAPNSDASFRVLVNHLLHQSRLDTARVLYNLATAFRKAQRDTDALLMAQEAVQLQPDSPLFHFALALDFDMLDQQQSAIHQAKQIDGLGNAELAQTLLDHLAERAAYDPLVEDPNFPVDQEYWQLRRTLLEKMLFMAERQVQWHGFLT
jgi:tetratricopeptide (TPR) repeat protein